MYEGAGLGCVLFLGGRVDGAVALLDSLRTVLPTLGQVLDFLVPVAWIVWGLGIFGLLLLAMIGSRLLTRFG